jgi:hypothetical protein
MRPLISLLISSTLLLGCTAPDKDAATDTAHKTATTATSDNRSMAEKAGDAGLRAKNKAEELNKEAEAKGKEADAMQE